MPLVLTEAVDNLPTLPAVCAELFHTLDDPKASAGDLEKILEQDQSITAKLLSVANSPYYGFGDQISNVGRAIVVLGFDEVRSISMGAVLAAMLGSNSLPDKESANLLWKHSLATQISSRVLAEALSIQSPASIATAGLLHDLGWVVIMCFYSERWQKLHQAVEGHGLSLDEVERRLKICHLDAGRELAEHWGLPSQIAQVAGLHHRPRREDIPSGWPFIVCLADAMASKLGYGFMGYETRKLDLGQALLEIGISTEKQQELEDQLTKELDEAISAWSGSMGGGS